jgi:hypothetical protein
MPPISMPRFLAAGRACSCAFITGLRDGLTRQHSQPPGRQPRGQTLEQDCRLAPVFDPRTYCHRESRF